MKKQPAADPSWSRFDRILRPEHDLCREDIVWMLDFIHKKVAGKDLQLLGLSQPRLLQNFASFADTAMLLIHGKAVSSLETGRMKAVLREASFGLNRQEPPEFSPLNENLQN